MAETKKKPNTIKAIGKKVADNGNASDYEYIPIGADSDNVDRPDGSTVEESLENIEIEKVEIIPVETLPTADIKLYPFVYALINHNESKGTFYEYRNNKWIKYGSDSDGIWVGTKEECAKDFDNIKNGTLVIIIKKQEDSGETHSHDYVYEITKAPTYSEPGIKKCTCFLCGHSYTEEIPTLVDTIDPAGVIRIGDNEYATLKDIITFDTYYKDNQTVTIEATDNETGVKEIAYYLATDMVNESDLGTVDWTVYDNSFDITPNNNYIVYARITDNADNVTYICSDGIVMDNIPPVFEGLEDGGTYPTGTVLTVEEGATLTVNGEIVELVDNTYTFTEAMDNIRLSLTDKAGNKSTIEVIVEEKYTEFTLTRYNYIQTGIKELTGDIIIPATFEYEGVKYKISKIGTGVFYECTELTSVIIPYTVKELEEGAFNGCTNLLSVTVPDSIISMSINVFYNCKSLFSISMPKNIRSIYSNAFYGCSSLTDLDISNVTFIDSNAFSGCTSLEIIIPDNVYYIGKDAFYNVPHIYYNGTAKGAPWGALAMN